MRESVRLYIKSKPDFNPKQLSIVFVATQKVLGKDFYEVDTAIQKIMSKINA